VTPEAILNFSNPETIGVGIPGGGGVASAAELAMFYQVLLNRGETTDGVRVLKPETIDFALKVRNSLPDPAFNVPANRD
jgi:hypothetical protein